MRLGVGRLTPWLLGVSLACTQTSTPPEGLPFAQAPAPGPGAQAACTGSSSSIHKDVSQGTLTGSATYALTGRATVCSGILYLRNNDGDAYATEDACCVICDPTDTTCPQGGAATAWHGYFKATDITPVALDCNDAVGTVFPGATETPDNGVDDDCNGTELCYKDNDDDNYRPDATSTVVSSDLDCTDAGEARATDPITDCNDNVAAIRPGVTELPADGVDQNCDGIELCYVDADNDNFRPTAATTVNSPNLSCDDPGEGTAADPATDCDDSDAAIHPGATEIVADGVDQDCDSDELCYLDNDNDNFRPDATSTIVSDNLTCVGSHEAIATDPIGDCDDDNPAIRPDATEIVGNGVDENCDSSEICYVDADDDNFRPIAATTVASANITCTDPGLATSSAPATDCDDGNAAVNPSATEIPANGADDNCNGSELCYKDMDNDDYRPDATSTVVSVDLDCLDSTEALSTDPTTDCDDANPNRNPGKTENIDNGVDEDCDSKELCYRDADDDGYRPDPTSTTLSNNLVCTDAFEARAADPTTDCDDNNAGRNPGRAEIVDDGIDQDCDNVDMCYRDADDDGYRPDTTSTTISGDLDCADPFEGQSTDPTNDCDDGNPNRNPGSPEIVGDGIDQDCFAGDLCYKDADDDGYRPDAFSTVVSADLDCTDPTEATPSDPTNDCDDTTATRNPGATEVVGDTIDQNCDGLLTCYVDSDLDTYGALTGTNTVDATLPGATCVTSGSASQNTDCDDSTEGRHPNLAEIADDGIDQDCVSGDVCYADNDDDGYRPDATSTVVSADLDCLDANEAVATDPIDDCDDSDPTRNPGATEITGDGIDQDCSGGDSCFLDADDDGHRPLIVATTPSADNDCDDPFEAVASDPADDCDDNDPLRYPGRTEIVDDGIDQNCDFGDLCFRDADDDAYRPDAVLTVASADLDCDDAFEARGADPIGDCDDNNAGRNPGQVEIVGDGIDQDCADGDACYTDADDDGHRPLFPTFVVSVDLDCDDAFEAVATDPADDCDDLNAGRHPGLAELINDGIDQDCFSGDLCYLDADDDGYRPDATSTVVSADLDCADFGEAIATDPTTDCDDSTAGRHPGLAEIPANGIDEDCIGGDVCFVDGDGDGYRPGLGTTTVLSDDLLCTGPGEAPATAATGDCLDADKFRYPGSTAFCKAAGSTRPCEACEPGAQLDDDCNGDSNTAGTGPTFFPEAGPGVLAAFTDADGDGFGSNASGAVLQVCEIPVGTSTNDLDCDDTPGSGAAIHPGVPEKCDNVDQNCNGVKDEAEAIDATKPEEAGCVVLYRDRDRDGTGDPTVSHCVCTDPRLPTQPYDPVSDTDVGDTDDFDQVQPPSPLHGTFAGEDYVATPTDCDDAHADIRPDECHDGLDNDGDGWVDSRDPGCAVGAGTGVRSASEANRASTFATSPDRIAVVFEKIDGHDNECDGQIAVVELDCDDDGSFPLLPVNPPPDAFRGALDLGLAKCTAATPVPAFECWAQSLEITCDTVTGLWVTRYGTSKDGYAGRFAGGYRVISSTQGCARQGDCDDHCDSRCPSRSEVCDGVDNDCTLVPGATDVEAGTLPPSLTSEPPSGTVVLAELDFDGDGAASCTEDFLDGDAPIHEAPRTCAAFGEEIKLADCDDLCFYQNPDATETCNGFVDVCDAPSSAREGTDADGDSFVNCGAYGPADGLAEEDVFVPVWVNCGDAAVAGTALESTCTRAVAAADTSGETPPRLVPLISPRGPAADCDAPLSASLLALAKRAGIPDAATWLASADAPELVHRLCTPDAPTGGLCSTVALTLLRDDEVLDEGAGGALDAACAAMADQSTVRTVWSSARLVEARRAVVAEECLRLFGVPCDEITATTPRVLLGAPPVVDALLDGGTLDEGAVGAWWLELGRFAPRTVGGAMMTCWGDPRVEPVSARTGGDCDDSTKGANRDLAEGPHDLLLVYTGENGDCSRCVDGIDNNCDGFTDCQDPTCAVCFVGQGQGCAGARDACGDAAAGEGCSTGTDSKNLAILAMVPLLGLLARRRRRAA